MRHYLLNVMKINGNSASVRYGDLDWNAFLLDVVDWNEMAANEGFSILEEAFGNMPDEDTIRQYFDQYYCDIEKMWPSIDNDAEIKVDVARNSDGDIDEYETEDVLYDAIVQFIKEETHLTDEQREAEIARLRNKHPRLVENN